MAITYATSHIDGGLDCSSLAIGVLKNLPETPVIKAMIIAGKQKHPIWALGRLALVIYSYAAIAKKHYPKHVEPIQLNIFGSLVSNDRGSCVVAQSVAWHTSDTIRSEAERMISELASGSRLTSHWPSQEKMTLPVAETNDELHDGQDPSLIY